MNSSLDPLAEALGRWRVSPPVDADFRQAVWRRVGQRTSQTWPGYLRSHATAWSLVTLVALGAAAFSGSALARARVRADRDAMVVNYLVDLDPRVQAVLKH